ncbi:hypothetical protein ACFL08_00275 [Patescibacteria group bacterium]
MSDPKVKRTWAYLVHYATYEGGPSCFSGRVDYDHSKVVSFSFPIINKETLDRADAEMGERVTIKSIFPLPFEGVELGTGQVVFCEYCNQSYKEPQYQCPHCKEYLV